MIALITGGSGSGKSAYAERLAMFSAGTAKVYLATMKPWEDDETKKRIARHRSMRENKGFATLEQSADLCAVQLPGDACVLLEDLPNLVANEMFDGGDTGRLIPSLDMLADRCRSLIVVTDNISEDGITYDEGTSAYIKLLNDVTAHLADRAEFVAEVVCGIPIPVKGELPCA